MNFRKRGTYTTFYEGQDTYHFEATYKKGDKTNTSFNISTRKLGEQGRNAFKHKKRKGVH